MHPPSNPPPIPRADNRHTVVYVLHSSDMYGTERMALATAQGLADEYFTIFIGPPGLALEEFRRLGLQTREYRTSGDLARVLCPILAANQSLTYVATGPRYTFVCMALNVFYRRRINQIQIVHGGAGEKQDYARKKFLSPFNIRFITVSEYSKRKLSSYSVPADQIEIVPNFLSDEVVATIPRHPPFTSHIKNAIVSSRTADLKRLDVLLDAMSAGPSLADFPIDVFGDGPDLDKLRSQAQAQHPNVVFHGFQPDVAQRYAKADLLVHCCPTEQFGLVIIEAMGAGIPVLVPDAGGAAGLVQEGVTGFKFRPNDPADLARCIAGLRVADPALLNRVVENASRQLHEKYSAAASLEKYRALFSPLA